MRHRSHFGGALIVAFAATLMSVGCGGSDGSALFYESDGGGQDASNPLGCPAAIPRSGDTCTLIEGTNCGYGCNQGGPATATCRGQVWSVAALAISCERPDAGDAGPPPAPQPFACGSHTCGVTQYCVVPCCGGAPPPCNPIPDGGVCPQGTQKGICPLGGEPGCIGYTCTAPPPYCVESPSGAPAGCYPFPNSSKPREIDCTCA